MTRLITIFIMLSGVVLGQTYNVAITNEVIVGAVTVTALVEIAEGAVTVNSTSTVDASISSGAFSGTTFNVRDQWLEVDLSGNLQPVDASGTRNIVPRDGTNASIGTIEKPWGTGVFVEVMVDNVSIPPLPRATPNGEIVSLLFDGATTQYYWGGIGYPVPTFDGTNVYVYTNLYASSNALLHIAASTQMAVHAWGAAGGSGPSVAGAGGYIYAVVATIPGSIYEVIVGRGGTRTGANTNVLVAGGAPGGGNGWYSHPSGNGGGGGGGWSGLLINGTTNYIVVAAGGGGSTSPGSGTASGGNGGGLTGGAGTTTGTNAVIAAGASATTFYGTSAQGGTNVSGFGSGAFLRGGDAQTNGYGGSLSGSLGGGGGGWYGGAAGGITNATATGSSGGGGGISYANPNYVTFAYSVRSPTLGTAPATDLSFYVSGKANSIAGSVGGPGLVVIVE